MTFNPAKRLAEDEEWGAQLTINEYCSQSRGWSCTNSHPVGCEGKSPKAGMCCLNHIMELLIGKSGCRRKGEKKLPLNTAQWNLVFALSAGWRPEERQPNKLKLKLG